MNVYEWIKWECMVKNHVLEYFLVFSSQWDFSAVTEGEAEADTFSPGSCSSYSLSSPCSPLCSDIHTQTYNQPENYTGCDRKANRRGWEESILIALSIQLSGEKSGQISSHWMRVKEPSWHSDSSFPLCLSAHCSFSFSHIPSSTFLLSAAN